MGFVRCSIQLTSPSWIGCKCSSTDDFIHVCRPAYLRPLVGKNGIDTDSVVDLYAHTPTDPVEVARGVYKEGHKDINSEIKANHSTPPRTGPFVYYKSGRIPGYKSRMHTSRMHINDSHVLLSYVM